MTSTFTLDAIGHWMLFDLKFTNSIYGVQFTNQISFLPKNHMGRQTLYFPARMIKNENSIQI